MNKIFAALALLLGTAAAASHKFVSGYSNQGTPREILNLADLFRTSYDYSFEWVYGVSYTNNRIDSDNEMCSLSVYTNSRFDTNFYFDILEVFHFEVGFNFTNFDVTPFSLSLQYTTPMALIAGTDLAVSVIGSRNVLFLDFVINYLKDILLPSASILDFILDSSANSIIPLWDEYFDYTNQEDYDEPYLSFDFGDIITKALGVNQFYGAVDYFNYQLI